jgi:hypothetical protein
MVWLAGTLIAAGVVVGYGQGSSSAKTAGQSAKTQPAAPKTEADEVVLKVSNLTECTEYVPVPKPCKISVNMHRTEADFEPDAKSRAKPDAKSWNHAHWDVTLEPGRPAWVYLTNKSPLLACTLTSTPTALQRDSSGSFTTLITSLAGLGLPGVNPALAAFQPSTAKMTEGADWLTMGSDLQKALDEASRVPSSATVTRRSLRRRRRCPPMSPT